jgi:hypothetical protein
VKCIVRAGAEGEGGPQAEAAASTAGSTESAVDARGPPSVEAEDSTRSKAHDFMSRLVDRAIEEDKVADKEDGDDGVTNTITTTDDASTIITHQATDASTDDQDTPLALLQQAVGSVSAPLSPTPAVPAVKAHDEGGAGGEGKASSMSEPPAAKGGKERSETLHVYLKSAVFKYLTADEGSSERTALVPVISNLLDFSQDEQDRATEVAAAQSNESGIVGRAWGWMSPAR